MFARVLVATLLACALSSCALVFKENGGKKIASFEGRSIVYGWIDMKEAGSNIDTAVLERLQPIAAEKLYTLGVARYKSGYILYHIGLPEGVYKLSVFSGHDCLFAFVLCDNGTVYDLPKQGSTGGVVIKKPGVYYMGALQYKDIKTGFWKAAKFDLEEAKDAPSQRELLQVIYGRLAAKHPGQMKRIEPALAAKG